MDTWELFQDARGLWRWRCTRDGGQRVFNSTRAHPTRAASIADARTLGYAEATPDVDAGSIVKSTAPRDDSEQQNRLIAMPITDAELVKLRLRYEAAYDAYQSCVLALEEVWRGGDRPSAEMFERHVTTLRGLNEQRTRYRDALVQVAFLEGDPPL